MTVRRPPSQGRSERRVSEVLAAARELLSELPAPEVTVRHVAERAGTSPASIYRYFDDVDQLVDAVLAEHARVAELTVSEALARSRRRSIAGVFELVVDTYLDLYDRRPDLTMGWRSAVLAERQQTIEEASDAGLAVALGRHLVERGLVARLTPRVEARLRADWTTAGALLGVALRSAPEHRLARVADLRALVRWLATRY